VKIILPYVAAFAGAFLTALLPVLLSGNWPDSRLIVGAVASALLATHLLDRKSPRQ